MLTFDTGSDYDIDGLVIATGILIFLLATAIIIFIGIIVVHSEHKDWDEEIKKRIPLVCSFAVISPILTIYTTILSSLSLNHWYKTYITHPLYKFNRGLNDGSNIIILVIDIISLFFCFGILFCTLVRYHTCQRKTLQGSDAEGVESDTSMKGDKGKPAAAPSDGGTKSVVGDEGAAPSDGDTRSMVGDEGKPAAAPSDDGIESVVGDKGAAPSDGGTKSVVGDKGKPAAAPSDCGIESVADEKGKPTAEGGDNEGRRGKNNSSTQCECSKNCCKNCCNKCCNKCCQPLKEFLTTMYENCRPSWYVLLSFIILGPILSVIAHSPYIAIAYLNDGYHAGSIFIYYTLVLCIGYSICWMSYHSLQLAKFKSPKLSFTKCTNYAIGSGIVGSLAFLSLVVVITVYFVIIPINKSISDAPNRLVGIYQSGGFLIASFVIYKLIVFFYTVNRRSSIDNAVVKWTKPLKHGEDKAIWDAKSSEDKIGDFYEVVVQIISTKAEKISNK